MMTSATTMRDVYVLMCLLIACSINTIALAHRSFGCLTRLVIEGFARWYKQQFFFEAIRLFF
jgi:hypothetical protein